jgi:hypothetical protein
MLKPRERIRPAINLPAGNVRPCVAGGVFARCYNAAINKAAEAMRVLAVLDLFVVLALFAIGSIAACSAEPIALFAIAPSVGAAVGVLAGPPAQIKGPM